MNQDKANEKFVVIDGNSLLNRAFYALPLLQTKQGFYTNAIYGFIQMLNKLIEDEQPHYLAVVFDTKAKTFRHKQYPKYKAHRDKAPEEMIPQMPMLKELLDAMNICYFEKDGYEADDLVGTFSKKAENKGKQTLIVTGDKDLLQLISDNTKVVLTKKGITNMEQYDESRVEKDFGVKLDNFLDLKALTGDKSDNVPGVPGVGEKTALKLLNNFGCVEKIYENLDQVSGKKLKENLSENKEEAFLSKELVTITREVPFDFSWEELSKFNFQTEDARKLLIDWEMKSIVDRVFEENNNEVLNNQYDNWDYCYYVQETNSEEYSSLKDILKSLDNDDYLGIYRHTPNVKTSKKSTYPEPKGGIVLAVKEKTFFVPENLISEVTNDIVYHYLPEKIITHGIKELWHLVYSCCDIDLYELYLDTDKINLYDTELMGYLIDPTSAPHGIEDLTSDYLEGATLSALETDWQTICERGIALIDLVDPISDILKSRNQWDLYFEIELQLALILARMEHRGIKVDNDVLTNMEHDINKRLDEFKTRIYDIAGEEFNLNSPKQLGYILFEKLELPVIKKTKTGYSTDAKTLEILAQDYEIGRLLIDYRQLYKLKTTYLTGLKEIISEKTRKIHTTFNQTITATGRLSSTEPNLQNIPVKLEEGRKIRKAFVVEKENHDFLAADYSQIELRILAHVSQDENLIKAFKNEEDIHTQTASQVFEVPPQEVTNEMRSHAKAVNFGIVYGISDYGLSTQLGISRKQAKTYIDNYLTRFSGVKEYMDGTIKNAKENGYVTTLYNRRRELPDITHRNFNIRSAAERTAINTPIQGTAADIIKAAMVQVEKHLKDEDLTQKASLVLQVHDELIFEVDRNYLEMISIKVRDIMETVLQLDVPLTVDLKKGPSWFELSSYEPGE
ncbi:DNA polymerase I [Natranaerobius trueperi]|uniref:DNA polymerase I n=2 Tax=Natranaerobius trueperi TaxID=759412 RepID=A0A226BYC5_9FIRM|nr:DNA polymerase I [Natranaerobius trueperi]